LLHGLIEQGIWQKQLWRKLANVKLGYIHTRCTTHASGLGGQRMLVIPELNIVAVFIGWNIYDFPSLDSWMVMHKLINAVER
jgi:hypothetical protein